MKRIFFLLALLSSMVMKLSAQTYEELCERAMTAAEQDSLQQAEEYIRGALKLDPANERNALLFSNLGTIQRRQRLYEDALQSYDLALNYAPKSVPILLNRATLFMEMGKDESAKGDYALVLDVEPDNAEALLMRAYIYMQERNYAFARADYEHLLKLDAKHYSARLGLAMLCQREMKHQEAMVVLDALLQDFPSDDVLLVARAGVENDLNQTDAAIVDLDKAIAINPSQVDAYLMRGQIYLAQKRKKQAREDFESAMKLGVPYANLRDLLQKCK